MSFIARYPGICDDCGQDIVPGQHATYVGEGEVVHVSCPAAPKLCPTHFIELPASGECGECA